MFKEEELKLTKAWDKVFQKSEKVNQKKVTFHNHFGITLAGDLYSPKKITANLPALAICGPFGAVKEQVSGLYAQKMAEAGFIALAFDPSFTGESGGQPRYMNSPDINTEDFQAAVDFLSCLNGVDKSRIGIIGICGWGGFALNTACIDTRVKATATVTMYDMSRVTGNGYFDQDNNKEARQKAREAINNQRTIDFKKGKYALAGGVVDPIPKDAPQFVKDYHKFYKTKLGYHKRSLASNGGWAITAGTSLLNTRILHYANEIGGPVLLIHGEKAHSLYFSQDTFKKLKGKNKELFIVPDASHVDLYYNTKKIPFKKLKDFFTINL